MKDEHELTKKRPKVVMKNFWGTKSLKKSLEKLKWKICIFIETKNTFNPKIIKIFQYQIDPTVFKLTSATSTSKLLKLELY